MKKLFLSFLIICLFIACNNQYPALDEGLYANILTEKGSIIIKLEIEKAKKKTKILINNKEEAKQSKLAEELAIQSIHPNSHGLVEGAPSERRSFMDWGLFHVEQNFKNEWSAYTRLLKQRNEALKIKDSEECCSDPGCSSKNK